MSTAPTASPAPPQPSRLAGTGPVLELGATKSSHRWGEMPGGWDRLNTRALFASNNEWGIPDLPAATVEPARLVAYSSRAECLAAAGRRERTGQRDAVHFFLDDYRFETVWTKPERGLSRCCSVGAALTPDFSLWRDMPLVMQLWQVYRSRWCGAWLLAHGIPVVPTVSWSTPDTYHPRTGFAFAGIPTGSVVAVSTVGTWRDPEARALFTAGYAAMLDQLRPSTVLVYGKPPTEQAPAGTRVRCYPSRWDKPHSTTGGGDR
ncbi:DUF4417 domain-containing protein [Actinophytocola gossypii]|uniref:DUF4417 domain-containing protein n=1 Tax=Actinophytocola gossypii TaxID=2812003 RepID=A0ABT2JIT1_9PSEU|nr:DUF4417 domain-containing protein [Actinophytocola gossypii]MCT2587787.1 DUF4417 domain-containing protein [Actinophytocola gossypii]